MLYQLSHVRVRAESTKAGPARSKQRRELSAAGVPEAPRAPMAVGKLVGRDERCRRHRRQHELGDAVTPVDLVIGDRIGVDQQHLQLPAIARVDEPGRVQAGHTVLRGEPGAGQYEPRVALRKRHRHPRRHDRPAPTGAEQDVFTRAQIRPGIARPGVARNRGGLGEQADGNVGHGPHATCSFARQPGCGTVTIGLMLAWMDLEMTGLDPSRHVIVEIATLITDDDLEIVAEGPDLVVSATDAQLGEMDDVVRKMHTDSGLLEEIHRSTLSLEEAGKVTLEFLRAHLNGQRVPLCGNSIGVDRRFLRHQLAEIDEYLHYRSVDVSTVKELCRRWYPAIYGKAPKKQGCHRALEDIRESVAELAYYKRELFCPPRPEPSPPAN